MRLFIAVELTDEVRKGLGAFQHSLAPRCSDVRWIPPHQLHLTLKFLGDVPDRQVPAITEATRAVAMDTTPFAMSVSECGCFPPKGPVRIVWAGVTESSGTLADCVGHLEDAMEAEGWPKEQRPFSAHITIGRVREDRSGGRLRSVIQAHGLNPLEQTVSRLTVMSSVLSRDGPTYAPVQVVTLGPVGPG